jgi:hypothetical protein
MKKMMKTVEIGLPPYQGGNAVVVFRSDKIWPASSKATPWSAAPASNRSGLQIFRGGSFHACSGGRAFVPIQLSK